MHTKRCIAVLLSVLLAPATWCLSQDALTVLVASPLTSHTTAVTGTDGKLHVVYELVLTNTRPTPATVTSIEVINPDNPAEPLATYQGSDLLRRLHTLANASSTSAEIEFNGTRLFLIDIALDPHTQLPSRLEHRFHVLAAGQPGPVKEAPVPLTYTVAPIKVDSSVLTLGPPLAGKGWVALNGCCRPDGIHRGTGLPVNGQIFFAQRFAIDWLRLDADGRLVHGDPANVHSYPCYGADVLAVADGTVVSASSTFDDQVPGTLPDPATIDMKNVDGNHIVLDLGHGVYALYAHLQKNSLLVAPGAHVKRGQVMAKLGNTGNSSGPHLHFQLMDRPSALGANGLPYVIDHFDLAGQISSEQFEAAPGVEGDWSKGLLAQPTHRENQLPLDLTVINF